MLTSIFTASRTVERPTPKIRISSGSAGSFSPTSNCSSVIRWRSRSANSSASDLFRMTESGRSFIISSDVSCKDNRLFGTGEFFRYFPPKSL